jgi:DNA invertase Pin-like site-specific DNA recombinase
MQYGYGRVSTLLQDTALQEDAFRRAGVQRVVLEKASGASARPRLRALVQKLRPGDVVVVYKLDRMGRSLQDLLAILNQIEAAGAMFRSLTEPIDTRTPAGKMMYSILGAVAEFERSMIRERSIAGQVAAFRRGVKLGLRRDSTPPEVVEEMRALYATGDFTYSELAAFFGRHASTVRRLVTGRPARPPLRVIGAFVRQPSKGCT